MAARTTSFWAFIAILILLDLILRVALGITVIPDLIVVAVLLGARRLEPAGAALFGLLLGVLADSLALVAFGASAVAFVVIAYFGARSRDLFEGDSYLFITVYAFLGSWGIHAIRYVIGSYMAAGVEPTRLLTDVPLESLYVTIAAIVALVTYRAVTGHR